MNSLLWDLCENTITNSSVVESKIPSRSITTHSDLIGRSHNFTLDTLNLIIEFSATAGIPIPITYLRFLNVKCWESKQGKFNSKPRKLEISNQVDSILFFPNHSLRVGSCFTKYYIKYDWTWHFREYDRNNSWLDS